jgi:hypothetical protein
MIKLLNALCIPRTVLLIMQGSFTAGGRAQCPWVNDFNFEDVDRKQTPKKKKITNISERPHVHRTGYSFFFPFLQLLIVIHTTLFEGVNAVWKATALPNWQGGAVKSQAAASQKRLGTGKAIKYIDHSFTLIA